MECPNCEAEMLEVSEWGLLAAHQSGEVFGQIYQCPNYEYFEDTESRDMYIENNPDENDGDETACRSNLHNGFFYTYKTDDLQEGYPC